MTDTLVIQMDSARVDRWLAELRTRAQNPSGLMSDIGEALTESTQERFATSKAPDGTPWAKLADGSGRKPLVDTGRMRDDISPDSGPDWVEIRAGAKQARWHQQGTDPYIILPKNGKALAFGDHVVRKVNHPGLPARPFLGLSTEDERDINKLVAAWLDPDE